MREPAQRTEHTGNPALDRMQASVRDLLAFTKRLLARVVGVEHCHGVGIVRAEVHNVDRALTAAEFGAAQIVFVGTLTANRIITVPDATDATAYIRWITNVTTGGFSLVLKSKDGTATVASPITRAVVVSASGPALLV